MLQVFILRGQMQDAYAVESKDIYDELRATIATQPQWSQPLADVFTQEYAPLPRKEIIADFARENSFEVCDLTDRLSRVVTMTDLLKFYSTCSKLAIARPQTLLYVVPTLDAPHSLSVVEGLFALRASLLAGNFCIFFRDRKGATKKERTLMRTRVYDLCLWQSDNLVLLSNNTDDEVRRKLCDIVRECSICLDPLTDQANGTIVYPYRCGHAFHSDCVQECKECPLCRTPWKGRATVFMLRHPL